MNQTSVIAAALVLGYIVFVTVRGELPVWLQVLGITPGLSGPTTTPAPAGGGKGSSSGGTGGGTNVPLPPGANAPGSSGGIDPSKVPGATNNGGVLGTGEAPYDPLGSLGGTYGAGSSTDPNAPIGSGTQGPIDLIPLPGESGNPPGGIYGGGTAGSVTPPNPGMGDVPLPDYNPPGFEDPNTGVWVGNPGADGGVSISLGGTWDPNIPDPTYGAGDPIPGDYSTV